LTTISNSLTNLNLTDVEACYKAEGKEIGWRDVVRALVCSLKYGPFRSRVRSRR